MSMRRRWWWLLGLAALVLVLWRVATVRPRGIEVEAARAALGPVEDAVSNSQAGTVRSWRRSRLGTEAAGRVVAIPRREGSVVRRGELMLQLDETTARGQLELAQRERDAAAAAVESARAAATLAGLDFRRTEELARQALVSQEQMDEARSRRRSSEAGLDAAEARLEQARASIELARDALGHLRVLAPFDAVVTQRFVELGESVVPGQAVLEVLDPDSLYVSAPIDEMDIGRLRPGLPARVTLDPYPDVTWHGRLTRVAPFVNDVLQQNRTLEIEVSLAPEPGHPLPKPGASADVEVIIRQQASVLRVPTSAVLEGHRVMLVDRGRAASREVTTGLRNWDWTEIRDGLKAGDLVITSLDRPGLKPGASVRVREPADPRGGPPGGPRP